MVRNKLIILPVLIIVIILLGVLLTTLLTPAVGGTAKLGMPGTSSAELPFTVSSATTTLTSTPERNCTYTYYYWQSHPELWPKPIDISGQMFTPVEVQAIFANPKTDTRTVLRRNLVTAYLNVSSGADVTNVERSISNAVQWLGTNQPGTTVSEFNNQLGDDLAIMLDNFNDGLMGPVLCSDQPLTPTPVVTSTLTTNTVPTSTAVVKKTPTPKKPGKNISRTPTPEPGLNPRPSAPTNTIKPLPTDVPSPTMTPILSTAVLPTLTLPIPTVTLAPTLNPTDTPPPKILPSDTPNPTDTPSLKILPSDTPEPTKVPKPTKTKRP